LYCTTVPGALGRIQHLLPLSQSEHPFPRRTRHPEHEYRWLTPAGRLAEKLKNEPAGFQSFSLQRKSLAVQLIFFIEKFKGLFKGFLVIEHF
jgi:hypothetical protein